MILIRLLACGGVILAQEHSWRNHLRALRCQSYHLFVFVHVSVAPILLCFIISVSIFHTIVQCWALSSANSTSNWILTWLFKKLNVLWLAGQWKINLDNGVMLHLIRIQMSCCNKQSLLILSSCIHESELFPLRIIIRPEFFPSLKFLSFVFLSGRGPHWLLVVGCRRRLLFLMSPGVHCALVL